MITLNINGKTHAVDVAPDMPLLWVLRDVLGMTGTKYGCGVGQCGACAVHLDGAMARSCQVTAQEAQGRRVTTIEGLSEKGDHPLQKAWIAEDVSQCGYCQPGQIMAAAALLQKNPRPSDADINGAMSGSLCRCGTYPRIRKAIKSAAGSK